MNSSAPWLRPRPSTNNQSQATGPTPTGASIVGLDIELARLNSDELELVRLVKKPSQRINSTRRLAHEPQ
jgi:hypothetical protein